MRDNRNYKEEYLERGKIFYDYELHNITVNSRWIDDIVNENDKLKEENKNQLLTKVMVGMLDQQSSNL